MKALAALLACAFLLSGQKTHESCAPCHGQQAADFSGHAHFAKGLSCDACHGPSEKHRTTVGAAPPDRVAAPDEVPGLCGTCHAAEQKEFAQSKHGKLVLARAKPRAANCVHCHGAHAPRRSARMETQCRRCHAALPQSCQARPAAGREAAAVACMSCHAKHTLAAKR